MWSHTQIRHDARAPFCVAFDTRAVTSLSQIGRDFVKKLSLTDIPFTVFDTCQTSPAMPRIVYSPPNESHDIVASCILHFCTNCFPKPWKIKNAITPFWEFETGMTRARPLLFSHVSTAVVFSDFCLKLVKASAPKHTKVIKMRYPFLPPTPRTREKHDVREELGLSKKDFIAFFNFDFRSGYKRKNPTAIISAFSRVFKGCPSAKLIFKVSGTEFFTQQYNEFLHTIDSAGISDQTILNDRYMPHEQVLDMILASDVYISLHRGEGLGLGMLEAMSVDTPVICTNYGGNTEFCNNETAFSVDYKLLPCNDDFFMYRFVKEWADPDAAQATEYLATIREKPELGYAKAASAKEFIERYYSLESFITDVKGLMSAI